MVGKGMLVKAYTAKVASMLGQCRIYSNNPRLLNINVIFDDVFLTYIQQILCLSL